MITTEDRSKYIDTRNLNRFQNNSNIENQDQSPKKGIKIISGGFPPKKLSCDLSGLNLIKRHSAISGSISTYKHKSRKSEDLPILQCKYYE